jgi:hypothetical protein
MAIPGATYTNDQEGSDWEPSVQSGGSSFRTSPDSRARRSISSILGGAHTFENQSSTTSDDFSNLLSSFGAGSGKEPSGDEYLKRLLTDNEIERIRSDNESLTEKLLSVFVFEDAKTVRSFLGDHPSIPDFLIGAAPLLKKSFGDSAVLQLQIPLDDEIPTTIYAVALWDGTLESARAALKKFDDAWGTSNSHTASGRIVFDYQLV